MRLHEIYFGNLTKNRTNLEKTAGLEAQISRNFGSHDAWEKDFRATGSLRGIGWAALVWDAEASRLFNVWMNEHDRGQLVGCQVLLLMDVFEHAFMTNYGTKRADYIEAFLAAADWDLATPPLRGCPRARSRFGARLIWHGGCNHPFGRFA